MAERRIVSVLFADVVGFTALSEGLDPEDLVAVQDAYFGAVRETLERYGGVLEKFIGDAAVAVFGVPRARADDAERAVRGALALHAAVAALAARLDLEPGRLQIRVGVNTGEVAYSPEDGRVTGDVVNVAARLQGAATPGHVVIGAETALAVEDAFVLEPLGGLDLKGKAEDVRGSVVAGIRPSPSREAALGRLRARTVGRADELRALEADLDGLDRGGRWTMLVAPPGVGKSRLVAEFVRLCRTRDRHVRVLPTRCTTEPTHPFEPIAELLREALRASGIDVDHDGDGTAPAAALLRERLGGAGVPGAAHVAEHAVALLAGEATTGDDRTARFGAWTTTFRVLEEDVPTVWVVEDAHDASRDVLAFLASAAADASARRLVLITARPPVLTVDPSWATPEHGGRLVHLAPLAGDGARELVHELVGDALPPELVERVVAASDGNPLFVEELLRTWLVLGALRESYDGFELVTPPDEVPLPSTVQVLYGAQLDDLAPAARAVALRSAVLGRTFPADGVAQLAPEHAGDGLPALSERGLLEGPIADPLGEAYRYRHALLRDTAYRSLGRNDRAALHVTAAGWYEHVGQAVERPHEVVAHHYAAALQSATRLADPVGSLPRDELRARARSWRLRAARSALAASAYDAAHRHGEVLLELLADEPDDHPMRAQLADIVGHAVAATDLETAASWLEDAARRYADLAHDEGADEDSRREAARGHVRVSTRLALLRYDQVRFDETAAIARAALETVGELVGEGDRLELEIVALRGRDAVSDGSDASELAAVANRLVERADELGDEALAFSARSVAFGYGDASYDEAVRGVSDLAARAEALGRWHDVLDHRRVHAVVRMERDASAGLADARELPGLARSFGLAEAEAFATYTIVEGGLVAGAWDEAVDAGAAAMALADRHAANRAWVRTTFALVPVLAGRGDDELLTEIVRRHEEMRPGHPPLSDYARVVLSGVRFWAGRDQDPADEPSPSQLAAMSPGPPSALAQSEVIAHRWLRDGRLADVRDAQVASRDRVAAEGQGLSSASWHLREAWLALADHRSEEAVDAARRAVEDAVACGALWWEARALRALEAAGAADAVAIERRVRLEVSLGLQRPQLPPVGAGG